MNSVWNACLLKNRKKLQERCIWHFGWSIYGSVKSHEKGRVPVKKPFLKQENRNERLRYAKLHENWTENKWQQVLWSDQSKTYILDLFKLSICTKVFRKESLQPSVNTVEALSWFGDEFVVELEVCWGSYQNWFNNKHRKVQLGLCHHAI